MTSIAPRPVHRLVAAGIVAAAIVATGIEPLAPRAAAQSPAVVQGPPSWVTPGTRLSFKSAGATILSDGGTQLVEDPNGPLTDPATGTRYREQWTAGTPQGGTGFEGVTEVTVMGIEGTDVILSRTSYIRDQTTGGWVAAPVSAERVPGADVLGWRHPDLLTSDAASAGGFQMLRGQVTLGGRTTDAVTLVRAQPGDYAALWFDATTGQLLQMATRSSSASGTTMSTLELAGVRQMTLPGFGAAVPEAMARATTLDYAGMATIVNPMDPSQPGMTTGVRAQARVTDRGANWTLHETSSVAESIGTPTTATTASGGTGPYWSSPAALAGMSVGQTLDQDPVTGAVITVSDIGQTQLGPAVAILMRMDGLQSETHWDIATGIMLAQITQSQVSGITTQVELQAMP